MMPAWLVFTLATVVSWGVWGFESKLLMDRTSPHTGQVLFTLGLFVPAVFVLMSPKRFGASGENAVSSTRSLRACWADSAT
jgi:hypothetical protein